MIRTFLRKVGLLAKKNSAPVIIPRNSMGFPQRYQL